MRPPPTISSNLAVETPMYMAASSRDSPRRGTGRTSERAASHGSPQIVQTISDRPQRGNAVGRDLPLARGGGFGKAFRKLGKRCGNCANCGNLLAGVGLRSFRSFRSGEQNWVDLPASGWAAALGGAGRLKLAHPAGARQRFEEASRLLGVELLPQRIPSSLFARDFSFAPAP